VCPEAQKPTAEIGIPPSAVENQLFLSPCTAVKNMPVRENHLGRERCGG